MFAPPDQAASLLAPPQAFHHAGTIRRRPVDVHGAELSQGRSAVVDGTVVVGHARRRRSLAGTVIGDAKRPRAGRAGSPAKRRVS